MEGSWWTLVGALFSDIWEVEESEISWLEHLTSEPERRKINK